MSGSRMGRSPLEALLGSRTPPEKAESRVERAPTRQEAPGGDETRREGYGEGDVERHGSHRKATFSLPVDLLEEARAAVLELSGPPLHLTLAGLVDLALRRELERLRQEHHGGERFEGTGKLRPGRRAR